MHKHDGYEKSHLPDMFMSMKKVPERSSIARDSADGCEGSEPIKSEGSD